MAFYQRSAYKTDSSTDEADQGKVVILPHGFW
jgi:hypothetical protein